jgi:hypothetical protein
MAGYTQAYISKALQLSPNTVSKWSMDDAWSETRTRISLMETNTVNNLMEIFDYQVSCLKTKMEERRQAGEMVPFMPGEFDALQKLFTTIKPDWQNFRIHVEVLKKFVEYVQSQNLDLAKQITEIADMYIVEKSRTR